MATDLNSNKHDNSIETSIRLHIFSDVKPSLAASAPLVTIGGEPGKFYTLVMIDPDDPSPSEPTPREWAHWIVTDIPGGSIASQGKEILSYMPPHPQVGIHRYVVTLYRLEAPLGFLAPPNARACFSTSVFARATISGRRPVSIVYFNAHREPCGRKRSRNQ
ncbi:protein MOTHER of FT and TFL1-like [Coffea arabica]|uniref:Protein MOTHER of FT and TFL1-like n=1 Tax=Coffea arabica TaxID=13443 RepID=A0ABM4U1P3_COFAR